MFFPHGLINLYSRSYAADITSVTSGASQVPPSFNSRSYTVAEDVTSVTSGASQGPHSFNLVFVFVFVCLFVSRLALSVSDGKKHRML